MENNNLHEKTDSRNMNLYGKKTVAVPAPKPEIGIDTEHEFISNIIDNGVASSIDISVLSNFTQMSQQRNTMYDLLDAMAEDSTMAAVLETYAEDATEYNDQGRIIWADSNDDRVLAFVNYLLDTLKIDSNIYKWTYSLCKYGDLYLRLFRESTVYGETHKNDRDLLNEDVKINAYKRSDHFVHYVEMCPNPAEMFELTRFGKTAAYIKADVTALEMQDNLLFYNYKINRSSNDVNVYPATEFVHASLEDNISRSPEEITLFENDADYESDTNGITYSVRRGQSLLYKAFRIWRQLQLLENSILLNRLTKSSIVRVVNVEVGDMPKESVGPHLRGIKTLFEQKSAIQDSMSMTEYANPGPIDNTVYVPTHNGQGSISTQEIGGNVDVKGLADIDYFKNKLYSAVRIPKQYLGDTDDATGFNGGSALSLVSSRYAKLTKRIQNTLIQAITDIINIMLLDKGMDSYINKFKLHITPPTTQEEIDRRESVGARISQIGDIINLCGDIEDVKTRLDILKSLLSDVITDEEVIADIQAEIDRLEKTEEEEMSDMSEDDDMRDMGSEFSGMPSGGGGRRERPDMDMPDMDMPDMGSEAMPENPGGGSDETLPSIADIGIDMTDNTGAEQA